MITKNQLFDIFALNNKGYIFPSSYAVAIAKKMSLSDLSAYSHLLLESFINQDTIQESYVNAIFKKQQNVDLTINIDDVILDDVSATTAFYILNNQQANTNEKIQIKTKTTVIVENSNVRLKDSMEKEFSINRERYRFLKWFQDLHKNKISIIPPKHGTVGQLAIDHLVKIINIKPAHHNKKENAVRFQVIASNHSVAKLLGAFGILSIQVPITEIPNILKTGTTVINHPNIVGISIYNHLKGNDNIYDIAISIVNDAKKRGFQNSILEFKSTPYEFSISDRLEIAYLIGAYSTNRAFFPMDKLVTEYFDMPDYHKLLERYASNQNLLITRIQNPTYRNEIAVSLKDVPFNIIVSKNGMVSSERITNTPNLFSTPPIITPYKGKKIPNGAILLSALDLPLAFDNFDKIINIGLLAKKLSKLGLKAKPWVKTIFNVRSINLYNLLKDNGYLQALEKIGFSISNIGADIITSNAYLIDRKIEKQLMENKDLETVGIFSYGYNITRHYNDNVNFNIFVPPVLTLLYAIQGTANSNLLASPIAVKRFKKIYTHNLIPTEQEIIAERKIFEENLKNSDYDLTNIHSRSRTKTTYDEMWDSINTDDQELNEAIVYPNLNNSLYFHSDSKDQIKDNKFTYHGLHILGIFGNNITTDQLMGNFQLSANKYLLQHKSNKNTDLNFQRSYNNNDVVLKENLFNSKCLENRLFKKNPYGEPIFLHEEENYVTLHEKLKNSPNGFNGSVIFGGNTFGLYNNANNVAYSLTLFNIKAVVAVSFDDIFRRDLILNGILPVIFQDEKMVQNIALYGYTNLDIKLVQSDNDTDKELALRQKCIISNNQKSNNKVAVEGLVAINSEDELQSYMNRKEKIG